MFTQDDAQTQMPFTSPASQPPVNQPLASQLSADQPIGQPATQSAYSSPSMSQNSSDQPQIDQSIADQKPATQSPPINTSNDTLADRGFAPTHDPFSVSPVTPPVTEPTTIEPIEYVDSYAPPAEEKPVGKVAADQALNRGESATLPVKVHSTTPKSSAEALKELEDLMKKLQQQTATNSQTQASPVIPSTGKTPDSGDLNRIYSYGDQASPNDTSDSSEPPFTSESDFTESQTAPLPQTATGIVAGDQVATTQDAESDFELSKAEETSEALVDQNIFFLLGVEDSPPGEQEHFLDELQQTVWSEFLIQDLSSMVTAEQKAKVIQIMSNTSSDEAENQNKAVEYLDGIIPDFENFMMDRALKLKEDLVNERVASLKESLAQDPAKLAQLQQAEELMGQDKWLSAGQLLNRLGKATPAIEHDYPG